MNRTLSIACLLLLSLAPAAESQSPQFRFERQVLPGGRGPNRITPDVALLSGAAFPDLRDLRFFDATGQEIPYLLIPPETPEPRWKPGTILPIAATKTTSGFEIDFGSAAQLDRLRLTGIPAPFMKRFQLEGSGDRSHWILLVAEATLFDLPSEHLRLMEAGFTTGEFRYLRVTWDDRSSGVVPLPRTADARLVEPPMVPAVLKAPAEFQRLSSGPGRSRFQVRLPGSHLPLVALELIVAETRLLRNARVTQGLLSRGEVVPQTLGTATLRRVLQGDLAAADLRIPIRIPEGREIEIAVDDENNPPLNLTNVDLEFSPQPWIYFESPMGEPIVARYGVPNLASLRYDLEAIRRYVGRTDLKEAHWGNTRDLQPSPASADTGFDAAAGAAIDPKPFHYSRSVPGSPAGLTALLLDAAVLAHSRQDLADLRIVAADNRQIPYLLERPPDVLALNLQLLPDKAVSTAKESHYQIVLPFENLPKAKLVVTTNEKLFQRRVSIQLRRPPPDRRSDPILETVASASWRHSDADTPPPLLSLDIPPSLGGASAAVIVEEGDNRPLALSGARLELPLYRLRFFYPAGGQLRLLYGQETLAPPRYDLELLAPRLVGLSSRELALDKESAAPVPAENAGIQIRVFWGALVAAVLVILFLLVRLLRLERQT
jgi:hypothetical protein